MLQGSNLRPTACKAVALPTELNTQISKWPSMVAALARMSMRPSGLQRIAGLSADHRPRGQPALRGRRTPRNSQSPPSAVESTASELVGWAPKSSAVAVGPDTIWFCSVPRPSTDTVTTSPGLTGRLLAGVPVSTMSARLEGDVAREVGDQVVHVPLHLVGVAVLRQHPVDGGADRLVVKVPVGHQGGDRPGTAYRSPSRAAWSRRRYPGSRVVRSRWRPCNQRYRGLCPRGGHSDNGVRSRPPPRLRS